MWYIMAKMQTKQVVMARVTDKDTHIFHWKPQLPMLCWWEQWGRCWWGAVVVGAVLVGGGAGGGGAGGGWWW